MHAEIPVEKETAGVFQAVQLVGERAGDEEVLLHEAQRLPLRGGVVGVEHPRQRLGQRPVARLPGISSSKRSPLLPNVPTLAEQGLSGYDFQIWHGLFAPLKTPETITQKVHKATMQALDAPEVKERFSMLGFTIIGNTATEFAAVVKSELAKFRRVVADAGIKLE